jgi:hypothetical protein
LSEFKVTTDAFDPPKVPAFLTFSIHTQMDLDTDVRGAVGCLNGSKNGPNAGKVGRPSKHGDLLKKR